jgi:O-succinylbenzoic acid--CoA ligase
VALSKQAILASAKAVNQFLGVASSDVWVNPLPQFHIGGLAVFARVSLARAHSVEVGRWEPIQFHQQLEQRAGTITSLVPTQVYDLCENNLRAPESLRTALVGGGALSQELYLRARGLGWPLLPSYGMTETAAVIAAAPMESLQEMQWPAVQILPHIRLIQTDFRWEVQSLALFDGFLWVFETGLAQWEPRPDPFTLDDHLVVQGDTLKVLGRPSEVVKILGETVNVIQLKDRLQVKIPQNIVVVATPEPRRGFNLHLFVESTPFALPLVEINQGLLPFEQLTAVHFMEEFPRTAIGKINLSELRQQIGP